MINYRVLSVCTLLLVSQIFVRTYHSTAQELKDPTVTFSVIQSERKADILIDGRVITSYCWPDNVYKPILYPVRTLAGTEITRGFPLRPREGERNDHIHQVGIWFNYGNVNGYDFWGNGSTGKKSENGGVIKHLDIVKTQGGAREGVLETTESWQDPAGKELLKERTEFHFITGDHFYCIDRITRLTAAEQDVSFSDTKEGMYAIRVARQLELPSDENVPLLDASGKPGNIKASSNIGVTGNYRSSEGTTGDAVWGTRARWMDLYGTIGNEKISIVICDHPGNPSYPTFWHARGYGLFSANPFGAKDFTNGKEIAGFSIPAEKSVTFRYRTIITSGFFMDDGEINRLADEFAKMYFQ
jgi:hypothetical protein